MRDGEDRRDVMEKRGIYRSVKTKDNRNNGQVGCNGQKDSKDERHRNNGQEGCKGEKRDIQDSKDERQ